MGGDERLLRVVDLPGVTGVPGLVQGAYGAAGNLELVLPADDGGLWVLWLNADHDLPDDRADDPAPRVPLAGAAPRCWSGGLHFGGGSRAARAQVTQMRRGPGHLEVVVVGEDGALRRWPWTPEGGFRDAGAVAATAASSTALVELDDEAGGGAAHLLVVGADGSLVHHRADLSAYPALSWVAAPVAGVDDAAGAALHERDGRLDALVVRGARAERWSLGPGGWHRGAALPGRWASASPVGDAVVGLDPDGVLRVLPDARPGAAGGELPRPLGGRRWSSAAVAVTTLDGGRVDVVAMDERGPWHTHAPLLPALTGGLGPWSPPRRVRSAVWLGDPAAPVHRRTP